MNEAEPTDPRRRHGGPEPAVSRSRALVLACSAEALGTFFLVLVGTAVATAAVLGKGTAGPAYDSLAVALAFGLVLVAVAGSLGPMIVAGTFPVWSLYCAGPLLGGAAAALVHRLVGTVNPPKAASAGSAATARLPR